MEQYKLINAELMDQVQKQRITIGEMLKTNVLLKKQLLEEREIRLTDAQYNESKLKCAIKTLLNTLDLSLDNIDFMGTRNSMTPQKVRQNNYTSGQVCSELRYSTALLQRNLTVSPSKRSRSRSQSKSSVISCNNSLDEEVENRSGASPYIEKVQTVRRTPEPRHLVELAVNMNSPDTPQSALAASDSPSADAYMYSIIEESDGEETTLSSSFKLHEIQTLRGTSSRMNTSPFPHRDRTSKTDTQNGSENMQESSIEEVRCALQHSSLGHLPITGSRAKIIKTSDKSPHNTKNDSDTNSQKPCIENIRLVNQNSSEIHLTEARSTINANAFLTPRRSLLNFSSFNGIAARPGDSSTPRRDQETNTELKPVSTKAKPKRTKSTLSRLEETNRECLAHSRPSRLCRPKSLKERSCVTKLRNEGQT